MVEQSLRFTASGRSGKELDLSWHDGVAFFGN